MHHKQPDQSLCLTGGRHQRQPSIGGPLACRAWVPAHIPSTRKGRAILQNRFPLRHVAVLVSTACQPRVTSHPPAHVSESFGAQPVAGKNQYALGLTAKLRQSSEPSPYLPDPLGVSDHLPREQPTPAVTLLQITLGCQGHSSPKQ